MKKYDYKILSSISEVKSSEWNQLVKKNIFLSYDFLNAFEKNNCVGSDTGWKPCHIVQNHENEISAILPLYIKYNSYGEYVFDYAWANAYQHNNLNYYPKLLNAIPFTPISLNKILALNEDAKEDILNFTINLAKNSKISSIHFLFIEKKQIGLFQKFNMLIRYNYQFHWTNNNFKSFNDFLDSLNSKKRKKIKSERKKLFNNGFSFKKLNNDSISFFDIKFFYECYLNTYRDHYSSPYLNIDFFFDIYKKFKKNIVLIIAYKENTRIASSMSIINSNVLYGRYWGATQFYPGLHFEVCYYQNINYCIEENISRFEGGAQGEHKIARGLIPENTYSSHWIYNKEFKNAIANHLKEESKKINIYQEMLSDRSPFK